MKTSQTPNQRQKKHRDNLKLTGVVRVTMELGKTTAQILREIATEHGRTHAEVIELGIKMARKALQDAEERQAPIIAPPVPAVPPVAPLDELTADTAASGYSRSRMSASEARAVRLGLTGEVQA
ncbi:hypothetical protein [Pseudomonas brassicacearum]|uniref:Uncharacterized protein n=1 Tax=Pseudomonas brassicacearum TaxID=930166 RepID=A0A423H1X0_9PSED|nr:hypothetical protein [Pseudomonas brassicacearum]RON06222.1 hypothetical protein BK658_00075 [Pseudomonas brassicacearum]